MKLLTRNMSAGAALALAFFGALTQPALAGTVLDLPALGANDTVIWGAPAPDTNQFTVLSAGGLSVTLSEPNSNFERTQQYPPGGWDGNFPAGTFLITPQEPSGPVTFTFAIPIQGFGLTIDDAYNNSFTGTIQAFNGTTSLGTYSTTLFDTLLFLGVLDATANITSVQVSTTNITSNDNFAFGNLSLLDSTGTGSSPGSSTPEPASAGMLLAGLTGLAIIRRQLGRR